MNFKKQNKRLKYFDGEEYWESPSLAWIHRIRREIAEERAARPRKLPSQAEIRRLAKKYNLKIMALPRMARRK